MVFVSFPDTKARRRAQGAEGLRARSPGGRREKQVTIQVRLSDLDYFQMDSPTGNTGKWVVETGNINVMVGGSSDKLPLSATVKVNGYYVAELKRPLRIPRMRRPLSFASSRLAILSLIRARRRTTCGAGERRAPTPPLLPRPARPRPAPPITEVGVERLPAQAYPQPRPAA